MADNFVTNSGSGGNTYASDDIGGVHYPRVKITHGVDGASVDVSTTNPAPAQLRNSSGTEIATAGNPLRTDPTGTTAQPVTDNGGSITVDNNGTFAVQVDGSGLTALQKIDDPVLVDDAAFTPATSSVMMAGFEFNDVTPDSVNEGDAGAARMSANRCQYVQLRDGAGNERGLNIDASGQLAVTLASGQTLGTVTTVSTVSTVSTLSTLTGGGVAHDGVDSGNPIKIGAKAKTSPKGLTTVANDDRTDIHSDADGILLFKANTTGADLISERVSDTGGTSTAFSNFTAVASTFNYVTAISVYNSSATAGFVDFKDGTGGSVKWTMALPAGGGAVLSSTTPLFKTSANTALAYDVSSALSTVYISVSGFQSKV